MIPQFTPFQQLLMSLQPGAQPPQQGQPPAAPQMQQPAPPQMQQAPKQPSRVDRLLSRYDQFATGELDPSVLNPQQRSLLRRQLAMQIGGALQAGQPIAAGVAVHQQGLSEMRQRQAAAEREQRLREALSGGAQGGGQLPMAGSGAAASPQQLSQRDLMTARYQTLLQQGFFEEADKLSEQINRLFPQETFGEGQIVMRNGQPTLVRYGNLGTEQALDGYDPAIKGTLANMSDRAELLNPYSGEVMATRYGGMTPYQRANLDLQERKFAADQAGEGAGAPGGLGGPNTHWDPTTRILYREEGGKWKPDTAFSRRFDQAQTAIGKAERQAAELARYANDALALADNPALARITGVMGYLPDAPGGAAQAARTQLEEVKSRFSLTALAQMRQNSPTGGAVGQVTEKEWPRLESAARLIRTADSPAKVQDALRQWAAAVAEYNARVEEALRREAAPILAIDNGGKPPEITLPRPNAPTANDDELIQRYLR